MWFVSRRGCGRQGAPVGVVALLLAIAASPIGAAPAGPLGLPGLAGLRLTLDDEVEPAARTRSPKQPKRAPTRNDEPVGQVPSFGTPPGSGAGSTGFISVKPKRKARTGSTAVKPAPGLPLVLTPSGAVVAPVLPPSGAVVTPEQPAPAPPAPGPPPPPAVAPKPVVAPKPPALVAREQLKEQIDALPNTVVARPRTPEEDPFAPPGIRAGALILRPAIETTAGYNTNPGQVIGGAGSQFIEVAPELVARSDWVRHELTAEIRGSYIAYEATPELNAPNLAAKVAGRVDVTNDTHVLLEGRYLLAAANPGTPGLPAGLAALPIITTPGATAGLEQRFNRLELSVKGTFDRIQWGNSKLTDGEIISNKGQDYNQYGVEPRLGYELTPGFKPFVDVAFVPRVYDLPIDAGGAARSSDGVAAKAGAHIDIARTLTGDAAIGYLVRTYKDPSLPDMRGVLVDAALVWTATGLTNVKLTATTTQQETTLTGVSGILSYDTGVEVDHAFRRWLIGTAKLAYGLDDFVGSPRQDQRFALSAGITYKLTRTLQVKAEVRREGRRSNEPVNDYDATVGTIGLRWQP